MKNNHATTVTETAAVPEQGTLGSTEKAPSKVTQKQSAPKAQKKTAGGKARAAATKNAKPARKAARPVRDHDQQATAPRPESKGAKIIEMIGRGQGATLAEIRQATAWKAHSIRGFLSTSAKKYSRQIESSKNEAGDRVYRSSNNPR
jgi:hypothetical protein